MLYWKGQKREEVKRQKLILLYNIMDIDDICKYIGYAVVFLFVIYFAVKSVKFQYNFVEGFFNKTPTEGFLKKEQDT
jgi:hypothetical protein